MKRSVLGMLGCMIAAVAFAQDPVYSVNVVGFNKHTLEKGKLYLIATAFEDIDGKALKAADVIGDQLPADTEIHFYRGTPTPYVSDLRDAFDGWSENITFHGFMGFWVKIPAGASQPSYEIVLKGQVPMSSTASNLVVSGLNMLGYPFTADVAFTNTALYASAADEDELHVYNTALNGYVSYTKDPFDGWVGPGGGPISQLVLTQGLGFWYKSNSPSPSLVTEPRPYPAN